ncbi:MAG: Mycothiol maleylpyruvate isomerase N-terminal domain-containing protein/Wyosine base formation [Chloroflexi bacterium]|nr:MAG: Mycothiol maleylpyruvate isomerase N-terminal domain-containing protein/Wyosine base formation [Chloroflexota bacterium]
MGPLIDDLVAEQNALDAALAAVPEADWGRPSPAEGWLLRDCIAHLAQGDEMARRVAETREPLSPTGGDTPSRDALHGRQVEARALSVPELVDWWRRERDRLGGALRTCAARDRLPWAGRRMSARSLATSRLAECWSHGLDALAAAGQPPIVTDRIRHVAHLGYITREFAYRNRGLPPPVEPLRVELEAPSGARWTWGPADAPNRISGSAVDFCRVVTQRVHPSDTDLVAGGSEAAAFLHVAQAFAGPPGSGRPPSS